MGADPAIHHPRRNGRRRLNQLDYQPEPRGTATCVTRNAAYSVSTADIAHAFLVRSRRWPPAAPGAKKKIVAVRIGYAVPSAEELPDRVDDMLTVIQLPPPPGTPRTRASTWCATS